VQETVDDTEHVRVEVVHGEARTALLGAAAAADLLVVGSRGRNTFQRLLLGSVSTGCLHHSACTLQVVRPG
jgi:nucleotide-binding universal stress UspA family protein